MHAVLGGTQGWRQEQTVSPCNNQAPPTTRIRTPDQNPPNHSDMVPPNRNCFVTVLLPALAQRTLVSGGKARFLKPGCAGVRCCLRRRWGETEMG